MRNAKGSLAGWLFADLTLVLAVIMLSSWTRSVETPAPETVPAAEFENLLVENKKLEERILILEAEIEALKLEVKKLLEENSRLKEQIGTDTIEGVKLEPITVTIKAQPSDGSKIIIEKIERELSLADVDPELLFSFALIFGGTQESPTEAMREEAKTRAKAIGDKLRSSETQSGWERFKREQYVRPFHDIGLGYGFYKVELYPSN
jgi:hypothetical protein